MGLWLTSFDTPRCSLSATFQLCLGIQARSIQCRLLGNSQVLDRRERRDVTWKCDDTEDCLRVLTVQTSSWRGRNPSRKSLVDASTWVTLLTTWSLCSEPGYSMSSVWGGQFILSNAASRSIFSAVFRLVKPRRASLSSIRRQRRTWAWLWYDESVQETSKRKKHGHEVFTERHLWSKCSTERYSNPAELICKTIEHVIRTLRHNRQGVESRGTHPERPQISIVWPPSTTKKMLAANKGKRPKRYNEPPIKTKANAIKFQSS